MHTLPSEVTGSIGTSTVLAAWNAAIYVAQVEDERLNEVVKDSRYLDATREVLREHNGLWFNDESYVISRKARVVLMALPLRKPVASAQSAAVDDICAFLDDFSIEVTRPKLADLEAIEPRAGSAIRVYVSAIPTRPSVELVEQSAMARTGRVSSRSRISRSRNYTSRDELSGLIGRLAGEAGVRQVLIISGDRDDSGRSLHMPRSKSSKAASCRATASPMSALPAIRTGIRWCRAT